MWKHAFFGRELRVNTNSSPLARRLMAFVGDNMPEEVSTPSDPPQGKNELNIRRAVANVEIKNTLNRFGCIARKMTPPFAYKRQRQRQLKGIHTKAVINWRAKYRRANLSPRGLQFGKGVRTSARGVSPGLRLHPPQAHRNSSSMREGRMMYPRGERRFGQGVYPLAKPSPGGLRFGSLAGKNYLVH